MLVAFSGLFMTEMILFTITLLISGLMKTYKGAVRLGAGMLLAFYSISIAAEYLEVPALYYLTPLKYFDVYIVATGGIHNSFFLLAMMIMIGSVVAAQKVWTDREI